MIAVEGLGFCFQGSTLDALQDVNLAIEAGEFLVITGPSGCGKSTLTLALSGYLFRQFDGEASGSVVVQGLDVRQCPIYDVAEVVGLVQQNPEAQFCTLTVQDEVAFGLENRLMDRDEIRERCAWALSIVGAEHLQDRQLATLSGGEQQKIAIAAMMAAKPQVLIFDEPTSNLDPTATAEVFEVIEHIRAKAGITVLVVEHKIDYLLPFQPRLVAMEAGRIIFDGPASAWTGPLRRSAAVRGRIDASGEPAPSTTAETAAQSSPEALIQVSQLQAGHNGRAVLQEITTEIGPGEFVSIMGDNGSGKTTFLQSLLGLLKPSGGHVQVLGLDTRRTPVSSLARQVGFVFQNPNHQLFADSVWGEAAFASKNLGLMDAEARERITSLLARCGIEDRRDDHPYRLSYGQKRRLNLVSILGHSPRLILLDEVLIGQDAANAAFVLDLLRKQVDGGCTVIMVNHAPAFTRLYASRVIFFQDGEILVDAPTEDAFAQLGAAGRTAYVA